MKKPMITELALSNDMIMQAVSDYEREHPGLDGWKMPPEEFGARIMEKMKKSARVVVGGNS